MLVISRRAGESVLIGEDVEIQVLETGSGRVKLGINAPRAVPVLRNEVRLTRDQNRAAAREIPLDVLATALARLRPAQAGTASTAPKITSSPPSGRR
jgi:carbon storage regulator